MNGILSFQSLYFGDLFGDGRRNTTPQFFGSRHDFIQLIKMRFCFVAGVGRFL